MSKLIIYVCENFTPEFQKVVENEKFDDVIIRPYPCLCENKSKKVEINQILAQNVKGEDKSLIICSNNCDILKVLSMIPEKPAFDVRSANYCFSHLSNYQFINYILEKDGYLISSGWLNNWHERLNESGFNKETARSFYKELCKELVFFDTRVDKGYEEMLIQLSEYLDLPYVIIPIGLEIVELTVKNIVNEWRLKKMSVEYSESVSELEIQCTEYAAVFDLMSKISSYTNKNDVIEKISDIFRIVFGAQQFKFWDESRNEFWDASRDTCDTCDTCDTFDVCFDDEELPEEDLHEDLHEELPEEVKQEVNVLRCSNEQEYLLLKGQNRFFIRISYRDKLFGLLEIGDFKSAKHIDRYLNFAIEIGKVCGLVFSTLS